MQPKPNIALWGFGPYGRECEALLERYWHDECSVTAVFDRAYRSLNEDPAVKRHVYDPNDAADLYAQGAFDAVAVTIGNVIWTKECEAFLAAKGIPTVTLYPPVSFKDPSQFPSAEQSIPLGQIGYRAHVLTGQHFAIAGQRKILYVFDEEANINRAFLDHFLMDVDRRLQLYRPRVQSREIILEGPWCLLASHYNANYWHFVYEALDKLWTLEKNGYRGNYVLHKRDYARWLMRALDIDEHRVLWLDDLDPSQSYSVEQLVCVTLESNDRNLAAPVLVDMARRVLSTLAPSNKVYPERLFVKRIGTRKLLIPDSDLARYGFKTIVPEELTIEEQVRHFANARLVLTPHGANSTNSLYMQPGSVFMETFPNTYVNYCCLQTLKEGNVYYLPIVESHEYNSVSRNSQNRDYRIDPASFELAMRSALQLLG